MNGGEYAINEVSAPAQEPVTLGEAKDFIRIGVNDDDTLISGLIAAAREAIEVWLGRSLITTTWDYFLDEFPNTQGDFDRGHTFRHHGDFKFGGTIRLPKPPLQSVTSIKHFDEDGVEQTLPTADFLVDTASIQGRITPTPTTFWPVTQVRINAVTVRFVAGFGNDPSDIPETIRSAILLFVGDLYEHRESQSEIRLEANRTIMRLIWSKKVARAV